MQADSAACNSSPDKVYQEILEACRPFYAPPANMNTPPGRLLTLPIRFEDAVLRPVSSAHPKAVPRTVSTGSEVSLVLVEWLLLLIALGNF